jgi:hypothetical protein
MAALWQPMAAIADIGRFDNVASVSEGDGRTFISPTRVLPAEWLAELRPRSRARDDIAAVYWVTSVRVRGRAAHRPR